jgi:PAS domain S-box-containing protein
MARERSMRLAFRLTLAMVALVLLTATAVGLLTFRNVAALTLPRALDRIDTQARVEAIKLEASVGDARGEISGFRASNAIIEMMKAHLDAGIDPTAAATEAGSRRQLARRFMAELAAKPNYYEFRLAGTDDDGREVARVDRSGPDGAIRAVPDSELHAIGDRSIFREAIKLPDRKVYVSSINFSRVNGVIAIPHVPVLRLAAPVYQPDGRPFGLIIITVDLRMAFAGIRSSVGSAGDQIYVVNEHGDYLVHPDTGREFGFAFGKPDRVQDDFPDFAQMLTLDETEPRIVQDRAGGRVGIGWETVTLAGGPRVFVINAVPYARLMTASTAVRDASLLAGGAAVLGALALAVLLARTLTRPLVQMTKAVEGFSRNEPIAVPTNGSSEIHVLASAFARMAAEARESTAALKQEIEERRRIFDTSLDLILVVDGRDTLIRVSPSSESILGYRPGEMIGHSGAEFIHSADLGNSRAEMRLARQGRHTRNSETRYVHKYGHIVSLAWSGSWSEAAQQYFFTGRDTTEQKLTEEKFRLAVDASPSGLVMTNSNGAIVLVNTETERLFGFNRKELIGRPVDILVPAGQRGHHARHRTDFVTQPAARRMGAGRDLYGLRKDGTEFPIEIGLNPIHTQRGLLVLSVVVDISERKRTEAALRDYAEREQLFIAAVESSNDAIVTKTLDGVITGWNPAAERLFGFTAQEAVGKSIDMIVPDDLRIEVRGILEKIRRAEKVEHHETVRTTKDGRRIDVSLSISPIKSPSGAIIGAAKVARNITEGKRAQEKLLESEQMARGIIAHALEAFIQLDDDGYVLEWNPQAEAIFGWSRQEAVGSSLTTLFLPEEFSPRYLKLSARLRQADDNESAGERFELEAVRKDGRKIKIEVSLTALRRRTGYVFNSFVRDVTERILADDRLRQGQKMEAIGQLTGGIAHDFNNMLTVITGTIDILADAVSDKPDIAALAKLISEAADQGAGLTSHLLAFARKQPLQPRETDTNTLMMESVRLIRPTLGEHIEIEPILADKVWPALVDAGQLGTALLNLALNARDAMPNGGKLTLETENTVLDESYAELNREVRPGNYVMIAVSDTGDGIPEAIRDKIFEPFFTTKDVGKGTGLGLSMVYGFVKQSNGHIKIYSEEGHGTTFRIYLPQARDSHSGQLPDVAPEVLIEGDSETILVVEDDPMVRTGVTAQLQGLGYKTIQAANAAEALAIVDDDVPFDLLFTDVIMPGPMNGRQLAEEVAKRRSALKVLFTSGYTENAMIHHGRLDPGVLLLAKPYRRVELARMIRVALAASPAARDDGERGSMAGQSAWTAC